VREHKPERERCCGGGACGRDGRPRAGRGPAVLALVLLPALILLLAGGHAGADVPATSRLQGLLTDAAGAPRTGPVRVSLRVWEQPDTRDRAQLLFEERHDAVAVADGLLDVAVGAGTPLVGTWDAELFAGEERWLEVEIDGERLTPRQRIGSTPTALRAAEADRVGGLAGTAILPSDGIATFSGPSLTLSGGSELVVEGIVRLGQDGRIQLDPDEPDSAIGYDDVKGALKSDLTVLAPGFEYLVPLLRYVQIQGSELHPVHPQEWARSRGYGHALDRDKQLTVRKALHLEDGAVLADFRCWAMKGSFGDAVISYSATVGRAGRPIAENGLPSGTLATVSDVVSQAPPFQQPAQTQEAVGTIVAGAEPIDNADWAYTLNVLYTESSNPSGGDPGFGVNRFYGCRIGYLLTGP